ncbi:MFS transporter [Aeromicrobium alkaliterrae]|uniref:MFS transporter n=1 Tax=Aeromicrobium alkaliterrae TaxID=302168 RepID=A0ABP4WGN7_9ACTN
MRSQNRWVQLAVTTFLLAAVSVGLNAPGFLIPHFHLALDLSLASAGVAAAAPMIGMACFLVVWGALVDRVGERRVLTMGLSLATVGAALAVLATSFSLLVVAFFVIGAASASVHVSSARLVTGWFAPGQRGTAMGIRQSAAPVGIAAAAGSVPNLADRFGTATALMVPVTVLAVGLVACLMLVSNPTRLPRSDPAAQVHLRNPYRGSWRLARVHLVAAMLVVPQVMIWTFMLVWLIVVHDWSVASASVAVAVVQLLGAGGRIAAGWWSDVAKMRMRPIRWIAVAGAVSMFVLASSGDSPVAVVVIVLASIIVVADNGIAATAVAEVSGPYWSGRAQGLQNTGQNAVAAAVPPLGGALIASHGYSAAFLVAGLIGLVAAPFVPVNGEPKPE